MVGSGWWITISRSKEHSRGWLYSTYQIIINNERRSACHRGLG
jgi:hypothetical protein